MTRQPIRSRGRRARGAPSWSGVVSAFVLFPKQQRAPPLCDAPRAATASSPSGSPSRAGTCRGCGGHGGPPTPGFRRRPRRPWRCAKRSSSSARRAVCVFRLRGEGPRSIARLAPRTVGGRAHRDGRGAARWEEGGAGQWRRGRGKGGARFCPSFRSSVEEGCPMALFHIGESPPARPRRSRPFPPHLPGLQTVSRRTRRGAERAFPLLGRRGAKKRGRKGGVSSPLPPPLPPPMSAPRAPCPHGARHSARRLLCKCAPTPSPAPGGALPTSERCTVTAAHSEEERTEHTLSRTARARARRGRRASAPSVRCHVPVLGRAAAANGAGGVLQASRASRGLSARARTSTSLCRRARL
jgi:hypothetical protein